MRNTLSLSSEICQLLQIRRTKEANAASRSNSGVNDGNTGLELELGLIPVPVCMFADSASWSTMDSNLPELQRKFSWQYCLPVMEEVWGAIQHGMVEVLVGKQLPTWVWNCTRIKGISTLPLDPYPIRIPDTHT